MKNIINIIHQKSWTFYTSIIGLILLSIILICMNNITEDNRDIEKEALAVYASEPTVTTEDELKIALSSSAEAIVIGNDIELTNTISISRNVTIMGKGFKITTTHSERHFNIINGASVKFQDLTIMGRSLIDGIPMADMEGSPALHPAARAYVGGGIAVLAKSTLAIENCAIIGNTAFDGGGISASGGSTVQVMGGSRITQNTAWAYAYSSNANTTNNHGNGGGIYMIDSTLNISEESVVNANRSIRGGSTSASSGDGGGGIYALRTSVKITSSTVIENRLIGNAGAGFNLNGGGGITAFNCPLVRINDSTITGNQAEMGAPVGGLYVKNCTSVNLVNAVINKNSSSTPGYSGGYTSNSGGGIGIYGNTDVSITGCDIKENDVMGSGAGLMVITAGGSPKVTIKQSTITANKANNTSSTYGGGVYVEGNGCNVFFDGVEISGNISTTTSKASGSGGFGGAIYSSYGSITITNSKIVGNTVGEKISADSKGGGIFVAGGNFNITNVLIGGNKSMDVSANARGGGIHVSSGNVNIIRSNIGKLDKDNPNSATHGGGISVAGGTLTLDDCNVMGNQASSGAGIRITGGVLNVINQSKINSNAGQGINEDRETTTSTKAEVNITSSEITDNSGTGLYAKSGIATVKESLISRNSSVNDAGGINAYDATIINIINSEISANKAKYGGGIFTYAVNGSPEITVQNSKIIDNSATIWGGGICARGFTIFTVLDSVISGNTCEQDGGGIYNASTNQILTVKNCEIANNMADKDGGGVFTTNLKYFMAEGVKFAHNHAATGYKWDIDNPSGSAQLTAAGTHNTNIINPVSFTTPFDNAYSNFDVSFTSGTKLYPVTINYYKDLISQDNFIGNKKFAFGGTFSEDSIVTEFDSNWRNAYKPEGGYSDGMLQGTLPPSVNNAITIDVLYTRVPAIVTVKYYKNTVQDDNLLYSQDFSTYVGENLGTVLGEGWRNAHKPSNGYYDGQLQEILPEIVTDDIAIIVLYTTDSPVPPDIPSELPKGTETIPKDDGSFEVVDKNKKPIGPVIIPNKDGSLTVVDRKGKSLDRHLIPKGNGSFEVVDENDSPIGNWKKDKNNKWVYEKYAPETGYNFWYPIFILLGMLVPPIVLLLYHRRNITRAQFVKMIVKAIQLEKMEEYTSTYDDVAENTRYYDVIMAARAAGILAAFTESDFHPNIAIRREEMASVLAAVIRYKNYPLDIQLIDLETTFNDYSSMDQSLLDEIALVCTLNIMTGKFHMNFDPEGYSNRREARDLINNLLDILNCF